MLVSYILLINNASKMSLHPSVWPWRDSDGVAAPAVACVTFFQLISQFLGQHSSLAMAHTKHLSHDSQVFDVVAIAYIDVAGSSCLLETKNWENPSYNATLCIGSLNETGCVRVT